MRHPRKTLTRTLSALAPLALLGTWACGLFDSLQSDKVLAATVLATPSYSLSSLLPDASFPFDAGGFALPDAGLPSLPSQTVAEIFFGQRNSDPTKDPKGVAGAQVKLSVAGRAFALEDRGSGSYGLNTQQDPAFVLVGGARYELTVTHEGETYTAEVDGPAEELIEQFRVLGDKPLPHAAHTPLQLTRTGTENVAFTSVIPVTASGEGKPTWTNMPSKPLDLLDLIANDAPWKTKVITIPAEAFPQAGTEYAVVVAAVRKGSTSDNLFTASALLVGRADVGRVRTK